MTTLGFAPQSDPRAFRNALGRFATGVTVITAQGPNGPLGFTANSFAALSLDPPLVLWSPARSSSRFPVFSTAQAFTIHVLAADQASIGARFVRGGAGFDGLEYDLSDGGAPVLAEALARFDCRLHATHEGGDHLIVVGLVDQVMYREGAPLVFSQGSYGGFAPHL
jgi:flavin reductase (DIM6/NTAB) family NADH-FMN oxidoreductase RutF